MVGVFSRRYFDRRFVIVFWGYSMPKNLFSVAILLASMTGTSFAGEFGRISAEFGGETREWYSISMEQGGEIAASARMSSGRLTTDLHIQGHPGPSFTTTDVLSIDAMFIGKFADDATPNSVEVLHLPEGMSGPFWTSEGAPTPASVSFELLETAAAGEIGRTVGSFMAELCRKVTVTAEPDTSDCRPITGTFDTQLLME